jgi:hypothetical protein
MHFDIIFIFFWIILKLHAFLCQIHDAYQFDLIVVLTFYVK